MRQPIIAISILILITSNVLGQDKDSLYANEIIFVSEPQPSYPGGYVEMGNFFKKNLKYPRDSRTVKGKVFIEFIVNVDGSLSDFKILKGLGKLFDSSALETIKKMPNWIPAKRDNKPILTKMVMPVTFDIE
jgi:protein TonB